MTWIPPAKGDPIHTVTLPYQPTEEGAYPPILPIHVGDVGLDIHAQIDESVSIGYGRGRFIPGNIRVDMPDGYFGMIFGRSSLNERGLLVAPAVIDNGYQGPLGAQVWNIQPRSITINPGDRIAQIVLIPGVRPFPVSVADFGPSDRGDNGWGSTGK